MSTARISLPDRYRVVRHIANGGMASVWEAHDEVLNRAVAVKLLASHLSEDDRARQRFQREARAAAAVSNHPNVVTIYDVGEHDGRTFMVMELLKGGTVADKLRAGDRISPRTAMRWLRDAASALDAAHAADVVHRDVKPANMLLDDGGRLAIADFGIARLALEDQLTATGTVLGTAAYISPEQAVGEPATAASDRYALAVVAYELLAGARPFEAENFAAQARAHVEDAPEPASVRNPDLPHEVDAVLARGLEKDPEDRYGSAGELVDHLDDAVSAPAAPPAPTTARTRALGGGPPRRTAAAPAGAGRPAPRRRNAGVLLAALATVALIAVIAVLLLSGGDGGSGGNDQQAEQHPASARETPEKTQTPEEDTATPEPTPEETATPEATDTPAPSGEVDLDAGAPAPARGLQRPPVRRLREVAGPLPAGAGRLRRLQRAGPLRLRAVREGPRAEPQRPPRRGDPGARGAPGPLRRQREGRGREGAQGRDRRRRRAEPFDGVAAAIAGVPFMSPEQGRVVYDHVRATRPAEVLELGTAHGVGAAYMAAALADNGAGRLTTVDFAGAAYDPSPEQVLARAGVADRVEVVREFSSYTWWLKEQVQARSDAARQLRAALRLRLPRRREELDRRRARGRAGREAAAARRLAADGRPRLDLRPGPAPRGHRRRRAPRAVRARAHAAAPARRLRADRRPAPELHRAARAGRVVGLGAQGARRAAPLHARDQPPARRAGRRRAAHGAAPGAQRPPRLTRRLRGQDPRGRVMR